MSTFKRCDGCGAELNRQQECLIHGQRANGMGGLSPIPDGEFDWCQGCALIAFRAVQNERRAAQ